MRLWNPDDPYGIATARRTLLWFVPALIVIAGNRVLRRGDPIEPFLWLILSVLAIALLIEPVMGLVAPRRDKRRS